MSEKIKFFIDKYWLLMAIFLIAPYYTLTPLFHYETWPSGHDSSGTVFNAWNIIKLLREDFHFPPQWQVENFNFKGNPYWAFYQPLSYLAIFSCSLITSLFDSNYVFSAMKLATYISFLISEIGMFFLLREILKESNNRDLMSTFGAIIYLFAPYRFIDLYSRNAYSEVWVFPWMPFYILGFYLLFFKKEIKGSIYLSLSTACLLLSHLMPSFFFILITHLGFLITLLITKKLFNFLIEYKKETITWAIAHFIGLLIASFYILPAMTNVKLLMGDIIGFDRIELQHVLDHISWCFDMLDIKNFHGAWQVGQLYLVSFVILILIVIFSWKKIKFKDLMIFLSATVSVTMLFLMSSFLWKHLPHALYGLQFSWRLFVVYSVYCSIIVALLADYFKFRIVFMIILVGFHLYTGERFLHFGGGDVVGKHYDTESWVNEIYRLHYTTCNGGGKSHSFLPKTTYPLFFNFQHADKLKTNEEEPNTFIKNLSPNVSIVSYKHYGNTFEYDLYSNSSEFITFKQYFYPLWELYIDSKKSKNIYLTNEGLIGFEIPQGRHNIKVKTQ